jgi:hypothetical protein
MLVVPPGELQHHDRAHNAPRVDFNPLPATFSDATMDDAIRNNAELQAALTFDQPMPDAPAPDLTGLPALGDGTANGFSLAEPISFPPPTLMNMGASDHAAMYFPPPPVASDERLTAFARLRFDDGSYYMHTYQIILGRNIDLARRDMRRIAKVDQLHAEGQAQAAEELLNGHASKKKKRRTARSVISEKGGIVSASRNLMPMEYQQRRPSNASQSLSSASHPTGDSGEEKPVERAPQDVLMQVFPEMPLHLEGHVPEDPQDCPLVPIHPHHVTARTGSHGPKGISRQHAKIFFDFDQGHFCIEVLGSNGLHHENDFKQMGEIVPLEHGDHLVIGAVNIQFYLPDVALTEEQRDRRESGSRPMSFSFENGHGELESGDQVSSESEGEQSINPRHVYHYPIDSDLESDDGGADDDMDDYAEPVPRSRQKPAPKLKLKIS